MGAEHKLFAGKRALVCGVANERSIKVGADRSEVLKYHVVRDVVEANVMNATEAAKSSWPAVSPLSHPHCVRPGLWAPAPSPQARVAAKPMAATPAMPQRTRAPTDGVRDCTATRITSGEAITLEKGTSVFITQALGGSYTVATDHGLARIQSKDADALGIDLAAEKQKQETQASSNIPSDATDLEMDVWQQLRNVYDPEIPVNIVDLGLVYDCKVAPGEGGSRVDVKMTLTAPGCGMGPVLAREAEEKITGLPGVASASVEVVWDPPWSPERISQEGRQKLGMD